MRAAAKPKATRERKSAPANRGYGDPKVVGKGKGAKAGGASQRPHDPAKHPRDERGRFVSTGGTGKATRSSTPKAPRTPKPPKPPAKPPKKIGTAKQRKGLADQIRAARARAKDPASRKALLDQVRGLRRKRAEWKRGQGKPQVEKLPKPPKVVKEKAPRAKPEKAPAPKQAAPAKVVARPKAEKLATPAPKATPAPVPSPSPRTNFGPSKATVSATPDFTPAEAKAQMSKALKILGPNAKPEDIASIVGAPDNARVFLSDDVFARPNSIGVFVRAPGLNAFRQVTREATGELVVKNATIHIEQTGTGLGSKVFGRQVEQAVRLGATKIAATAGRSPAMNGYITWPKLGYDAEIPGAIAAKLPAGLKGAKKLSDLMKTREGTDFWTKHGTTIDVTFDLRAGSPAVKHLGAYLERKGISG